MPMSLLLQLLGLGHRSYSARSAWHIVHLLRSSFSSTHWLHCPTSLKSHTHPHAQAATKNATAAVDSVVRSVADTGAMQVEALVRSMTTDETTVSTVLELITMLLPEATAVTAMTVAQAVEVRARGNPSEAQLAQLEALCSRLEKL